MDLKTLQSLQVEIEELLEALGLTNDINSSVEIDQDQVVRIDLNPRIPEEERNVNMGILIGVRGETLAAVEHLLALMVNRDREEWHRVQLDVDNYRRKRQADLEDLALRTAEKVRQMDEAVTLRPMPNYERRIIHTVLGNMEGIVTESTGEGPKRRVVIKSK